MAKCKDGKDYLDLTARMVYNKIPIDRTKLPVSEVMQKIAKNRNWLVCRSWLDLKNKKFMYVCAVNAHESVEREVSFKEVCADYHWKTFEITNGEQTIVFKDDPKWEDEVVKIMKRAKKGPKPKDDEDETK